MSWNNKIVWSEGMFLQPQHFQQHDRYLERLLQGRTKPLLGYSWGFSEIDLDTSALELGKIQLTAARGIFPDGTPFDFPHQDKPPMPLDIDADMRDELVVLALPMQRIGTAETNLDSNLDSAFARFSVDKVEIADSNTNANNKVFLQIGQLQLKLMRKSDVTSAYTALGVAHVAERHADNRLALQKGFIPPMLHARADTILAGYVHELYGLLHQHGDALASRITKPGHGGITEIEEFLLLQTFNRYETLFAHLVTSPLLHPERLFSTCLSLAGDLAAFSSNNNRRPPKYPEYQHDVLAQCFTPLMVDLRSLINIVPKQNVIRIELQPAKHNFWTAIIHEKELLKTANFIFAVKAQLPADTLRKHFADQATIAPGEHIVNLVNGLLPGIPLKSLPVAPRQIAYAGFSYFELDKECDMWQQLEQSRGLGIHIRGNIADDFPELELELWAIRG